MHTYAFHTQISACDSCTITLYCTWLIVHPLKEVLGPCLWVVQQRVGSVHRSGDSWMQYENEKSASPPMWHFIQWWMRALRCTRLQYYYDDNETVYFNLTPFKIHVRMLIWTNNDLFQTVRSNSQCRVTQHRMTAIGGLRTSVHKPLVEYQVQDNVQSWLWTAKVPTLSCLEHHIQCRSGSKTFFSDCSEYIQRIKF